MPVLPPAPHGRVLTAMITPMRADGGLDLDGAQQLATHLIARGNDGVVLNGTTGESASTSDAEKERLVRAVREAVGDAVPVLVGVGTSDTAHTVELAHAAEKAGATGLMVVSPYYSRPSQAGLEAHVRAVADATDLPVMLYDIPVRTGIAFETETLVRLGEHPRVISVKDAKGDLTATAWVRARTDLAIYSGDDIATLPLLSIGAVGVVSVAGHLVGREIATMIGRYDGGDPGAATTVHLRMLPLWAGLFRQPAVTLVKAALGLLGLPGGPVRLPLVDATPEQVDELRADLAAAGVLSDAPATLRTEADLKER
jgi:4-hydroxy-tetrahydrodipicolinate synthase